MKLKNSQERGLFDFFRTNRIYGTLLLLIAMGAIESIFTPCLALCSTADDIQNKQTEMRTHQLIELVARDLIAPLLRDVFPHHIRGSGNPYRDLDKPEQTREAITKELKQISHDLLALITKNQTVTINQAGDEALIKGLMGSGCFTATTVFCTAMAQTLGFIDVSHFHNSIDVFQMAVFAMGATAAPAAAFSAATEVYHSIKNKLRERRLRKTLHQSLAAEGFNPLEISYFENILNQEAQSKAEQPCPLLLQAEQEPSLPETRLRIDLNSQNAANENDTTYPAFFLTPAAVGHRHF